MEFFSLDEKRFLVNWNWLFGGARKWEKFNFRENFVEIEGKFWYFKEIRKKFSCKRRAVCKYYGCTGWPI